MKAECVSCSKPIDLVKNSYCVGESLGEYWCEQCAAEERGMRMEHKFLAWDWDSGEFKKIPSNDVVKAIYIAWNYEFDVYRAEDKQLIFSGQEDNEGNSDMLEPYGLRLIDHEGHRKLQNIETSEIYEWD